MLPSRQRENISHLVKKGKIIAAKKKVPAGRGSVSSLQVSPMTRVDV